MINRKVGFNFGNSANNQTIEMCAEVRRAMDAETILRFEHPSGVLDRPAGRGPTAGAGPVLAGAC
ncbi:MAG: hypothetical protein QN168_06055 [Armatimonadota bacterium]|nr:hypothetical protein [Armatimonadota bacterium]